MRDVPNEMVQTWLSGDFTGPARPMCRVTVQQMSTRLHNYTFPIMPATQEEIARRSGGAAAAVVVEGAEAKVKKTGETTYASTIFGSDDVPMELPNLRSVSWSRSIDQDTAQATFEFYNSAVVLEPYREYPGGPERMVPVRDEMGFYTYDRGDQSFSNRWGHTRTEDWYKRLMPDNILRTYEGYGFDPEQPYPERDPNLVQTGVWIIDQVDYGDGAIIKVTCRDMARLLMDHIAFVPVIPADFYPLSFEWMKDREVGDVPERTYRAEITVRNEEAIDVGVVHDPKKGNPPRLKSTSLKYRASSDGEYSTSYFNYTVVKGDYLIKLARRFNVPSWRDIYELNKDRFEQRGDKPLSPHWIYPGQVFEIPSVEAAVRGHEPSDAFDNSTGTYWLSHGFENSGKPYAMNWIEGSLGNVPLAELRITTKGSGYNVYVSVRSRGKWINNGRIPYRKPKGGTDLGADLPYAKMITIGKKDAGKEVRIILDRPYPKVDRIRLTFSNMPTLTGKHRVGLHHVRAFTDARYDQNANIIPLPPKPGVRGIDDTFELEGEYAAVVGQRKVLSQTPQGDTWKFGKYYYELSPLGTVRRAHLGQDHDNSLTSFGPATVDLGIHDQVVTIDTGYTADKADTIPDGKWLIVLRADKTGLKTGVWITIDYDGEIVVYSVTTDPDDPENQIGLRVGGAFAWTDTATNPEHDYNKTPREITAALLGNDLVITDRKLGSDEQAPIRCTVDSKQFAKHTGTRAGFGLSNYSSNLTRFRSRTRYRRGVSDTFRRANQVNLGRADTGQKWRSHAGLWAIRDHEATLVTNPDPDVMRVATVEMFDSDQDIQLTIEEMGSQDTVAILLRVENADNCIRVVLEPGHIRVEFRVDGGTVPLDEDDALPDGTAVQNLDPVIIPITASLSTDPTPLKFRVWLKQDTMRIYLGHQAKWDDVPQVWTDNRTAFTQDEFGYSVGLATRGSGLRISQFRGDSLGASETWTYWSETTVPAHFEPGAGTKPGTYDDYTDIIKLLCAWGGLYWPLDATMRYSDKTYNPIRPEKSDYVLGMKGEVGRVWGDFEMSGTGGPTPDGVGNWDKKTLMDCINQIRERLNFLFYVDEMGGIVWRQPNIFQVGNNVASFSKDPRRTAYIYEIDEKLTLLALDTSLNSRSVRERNVMADPTGKFAALSSGWNPNKATKLRRVSIISDVPFQTQEEAQVMADMFALRQAFRYRTSSVTIPANPAIQIDDQIRIYEEVANEGHLHYVSGVESQNNLETGEWTYNLTTNWLGQDPLEYWAFDSNDLAEETQHYIDAIKLATGVGTRNYYEVPRKDTATGTPPSGDTDTETEVDPP